MMPRGQPLGSRERRLPFAPLLACSGEPTLSAFARRVGAAPEHVSVINRDGITVRLGDRWAVALGTHPVLVWGDEFYADIDLDIA